MHATIVRIDSDPIPLVTMHSSRVGVMDWHWHELPSPPIVCQRWATTVTLYTISICTVGTTPYTCRVPVEEGGVLDGQDVRAPRHCRRAVTQHRLDTHNGRARHMHASAARECPAGHDLYSYNAACCSPAAELVLAWEPLSEPPSVPALVPGYGHHEDMRLSRQSLTD